jgi:glutaredoxin 2
MLELYYSESCPYCLKVINHFNENGIDFTPKNIKEDDNYDRLMHFGRMSQVPFLIDTNTGAMMYESDKIIEYADKLKG